MAHVSIQRLDKSYGALKVLKQISIEINDGEFVALVGPSGCGKSTLLRTIAGLEEISGGILRIGERVVNELPPKSRDIAMVFQSYALYPHLTVAENMAFSLRLRKAPAHEIETRVKDAAHILGLENLLDRRPAALSGGQRQRVAMGRAIVRNPQVFLFDEPLSNLDAKLRVKMRAEIKALHQQLRTTTIYVTHDQIEAMSMADKIVVLNGGRVEQIGAPLDLYDAPANLFVAGFIGSPAMNQVAGRVSASGRPVFETEDGIELPIPADAARELAGRAAVFGVRPEHLYISDAGTPAEVKIIEPTGSESLVTVALGKSELVCAFRDRIDAEVGQSLPLGYDPGRVYLFDAKTGDALLNRRVRGAVAA